jgi:hypothetical protein
MGYSNANITHSVFNTLEDFTGIILAEAYDYGNFFDSTTGIYTAQQPAVYQVTSGVTFNFGTQNQVGYNVYQVWIEHYDQSNVLKNRYEIAAANQIINGERVWAVNYPANTIITKVLAPTAITMVTGDYLAMRIKSYPYGYLNLGIALGAQLYQILSGLSRTYLKIIDTTIAGGVFNDVDPNNIKVQLHKFNYPMTQDDFNSVLNNPVGKIGFAMNNQQLRYGWIKELKYNHTSAMASFVLSTSKSTIDAT